MFTENDTADSNDLSIAYQYFNQIEWELQFKNRYSNEKLDALLMRFAGNNYNIYNISKGDILYRARIYNKEDKWDRWFNPPEGEFKGYDAENSYVNKNAIEIKGGRCNPDFISYLYAAKSIECCIHEIRPNRDAYVSVANIRAKDNLRLLRFQNSSTTNSIDHLIPGVQDSIAFIYFDLHFMKAYEREGDYLLSQYISEKAKNMGYDGVVYQSAIYSLEKSEVQNIEDGRLCYAIFNYDKLEAISSSLFHIDSIKVHFSEKSASNIFQSCK